MINILLISIVIAAAASIGGIISLYTKEEMKQYKKQIELAEILLSIIPLFFIFFIYEGIFPIIFLFAGIVVFLILDKSMFHKNLKRYSRMFLFGIALGILFNYQRQTAFIFGTFVGLYNMVKGSCIGSGYISRKTNIFKKIGNFQALFIISSLIGFYILSFSLINIWFLYFVAGGILYLALSGKEKN